VKLAISQSGADVKSPWSYTSTPRYASINPLNAELNPICHLLTLLGAHHIFHVSGLRVKEINCGKRFFFFSTLSRCQAWSGSQLCSHFTAFVRGPLVPFL